MAIDPELAVMGSSNPLLARKLSEQADGAKDLDTNFPRTEHPGDRIVYSPTGEKRILSAPNAEDLVRFKGWFYNQAPAAVAAPAGKPKIVVLVSKTAAPKPEEESEEVDLNSLDGPELRAFAKKHLQMDFADTVSNEDVLEAIMQEQAA